MLHVDDLIYTGIQKDFHDLQSGMRELKHIPWGCLAPESTLMFCGIRIILNLDRAISFSQEEYYGEISAPTASELISNGEFKRSTRMLQRRLRAYLGASLRATQTRFDVAFSISYLRSFLPAATLNVQNA